MKITKYRFKLSIIYFLFPLMFLLSCDDSTNPLDFNLFTPQDDVQLGMQLDQEINANQKEYPILNSENHRQYVQNIVNEILQSQLIKYKGTFPYQIKIINTNTINAFAAPGGYLYVYKGLLKFVDNEATLAGVLAHEIAHAELRHSSKRITKQYGLSLLTSIILGNNPSALEQIASNLLTGLALLKNSRDDEYQADEYSFKYLQTSRWYPGAIKFFFQKIQQQQPSSPSTFEELLSTHPLDSKRTEQINNFLKQYSIPEPTESNLFQNNYQTFKNSLPN